MRLLIAGGGTADTSIPAWRLRKRSSGAAARCCSLEPRADWSTRGACRRLPAGTTGSERPQAMGLMAILRGLFRLPKAFFRSLAILRRFRPDVVLGVGGYASGPMVLAAALCVIPRQFKNRTAFPESPIEFFRAWFAWCWWRLTKARRFFPAARSIWSAIPCAPSWWRL